MARLLGLCWSSDVSAWALSVVHYIHYILFGVDFICGALVVIASNAYILWTAMPLFTGSQRAPEPYDEPPPPQVPYATQMSACR